MPNNAPIFSRVADAAWATVTAANTAKDGTGTTNLIFTADATSGSFLTKVVIRPLGTNVATVARFFLNNGSTPATAANNSLIAEAGIAATTNTEVAAIAGTEVAFNFPIPPGYKLYVALGTAVAGGMQFTALGGDY